MGQLRRWRQAVGHDWIWTSVLTLLVAAAGAGVAIVLTNDKSNDGTTVAASSAATTLTTAPTTTTTAVTKPATTTATTTTAPATTTIPTTTVTPTTTKTTTAPPPSGRAVWPPHRSGWSLFLATYPASGGRAPALATAERAARSGLPQAGVLDSSDFGSLRPGYYVVFSGIYRSQSEAESARTRAEGSGFGNAYPRNISP